MKRSLIKITSFLLAVMMAFSNIPAVAYALELEEVEGAEEIAEETETIDLFSDITETVEDEEFLKEDSGKETAVAWEQGTIASVNGTDNTSSTRLRTADFLLISDFGGVDIGFGYTMTNFVYDENKVYLGTSSWLGNGISFYTKDLLEKYPSGKYFRIALRSLDSSNITTDNIEEIGVAFYSPDEEIPVKESNIKYENVMTIGAWQDGALFDEKLFVLGGEGTGAVYDIETLSKLNSLTLDNKDIIKPHANSVCFGSTYYDEGDKYPLLYVNIYNNYASAEDRMEGTCCVYRITETGGSFSTELVQVIEIGFTEDLNLWKSKENNGDVRPYGNFVVDTDNEKLYVFVMRDANKTTRFFSFDIPNLEEGTYSETYGCNVITLESKDIKKQFDTVYFNYIQGCCYYDNKIISVEGFNSGGSAEPALRIVELETQEIKETYYPAEAGLSKEPEVICIDRDTGKLYYAAADGVLRSLALPDEFSSKDESMSINVPSNSFSTTSDAALYLRSQMIAREPSITLRLEGSVTSSEASAIITKAWEHTGVPNEGDYIRHNQIGYDYTVTTGEDENGAYGDITYTFNWLTTAEQEAEVDAAVDAILAELDLWEKTDYEKIKGAYDWITENVQYDFDNEDNDEYELCHSTYAAVVQKIAVCQGYATLLYRMMLELDIDCRYVRGEAGYVEPEAHAWNIVRLEDLYYNMDPTWDRDLAGFYRMFLCTESNFTEHHPDSEYLTAAWKERYPIAVVPYVFNVAASGKLSNGIEWVLDGDTGTLTVAGKGAIPSYRYNHAPWYQYRESVRSIVISEGITEVGERAFYWSTNCTSLTLPESLTAIREYGFNNLRALEKVTLPSKLKTIEFCAFSECVALKSIVIPDSVTTCGTSAFSNCYGLLEAVIGKGLTKIPDSMFFGDRKLWKVTFPEGLTYIGSTAFGDCGITYLTLPATLTGMGTSAFAGCYKLVSISVEEGNTVYKSVNGVLFSADGKTLLAYPGYSYNSSYTVPSGTVTIARSAFNDADNLSYVYFPSSLKTIEPYAFAYCSNLSRITFPSNITRIGDSAFRACKLLWNITFENDSVVLESAVFADCDHIHSITLPAKLKEIPSSLFYDCANLQSIKIPSTVTKIGSSAFLDCDSLTSVTIPGTVKSMEQQAFDYCDKLETVTMQEGVQKIGWLAFSRNPKLKKVVIPSSVTTIENKGSTDRTFDECPNVVLYVNCGTAGWNYARNYGIAYSTSHPYTQQTVISPTCTAQGYTRYYCKCGTAAYTSNYTAAFGHSYTEKVTQPTCTAQGYTTLTCTRCGYNYKVNYTAALGHSIVLEGYAAPTCTEQGYSGDEVCKTCGTTTYGEVIPATGHSFGEWFVATAPTCTEKGAEQRDCNNCDHYEIKDIEAAGHTEVIDKAVAPTCTAAGLSEGKHCSVCNEILVAQEVVAATGHNYQSVVTAPTCKEQGYTTHTCSACGDSYADSYVDAKGHSFGGWYETKAPAATEKGEERRDCQNCDFFEIRETEELGIFGDVNSDGKINVIDANLIRRFSASLLEFDEKQRRVGDVNGDGEINVYDASYIRRFAVKLITKFPVEEK